jgi:hypothetical protein
MTKRTSKRNKGLTARGLEKQLMTHRVPSAKNPPQHNNTPVVRKTVRYNISYTGSSLTQNVTMTTNATTDYQEYNSAGVRYATGRMVKMEVWFQTTAGGTPYFDVYDLISGVDYRDIPGDGVDWGHIAFVPCMQTRLTNYATTDTTALAAVSIGALEGCTGNVIIDVTCEFQ